MSDADKKLFPADVRDFNWTKFHFLYYVGLRVYALDDPLETWSQSRNRLRKLRFIHFMLKYFLLAIGLLLSFILLKVFVL